MCWPESGLDTVSVSDCHVVLGYLNPDNFLGGAIKLDVERARKHLKEQLADPLGLSVEDAAAGVIELLDLNLREYMRATISAKGYNPADFVCFSYGGAGPVHTYGYTEGLGFKDVVVPAWAAGFSAFGCACADFEYRYDKSVDIAVGPHASDDVKVQACKTLTDAWAELAAKVVEEFVINGFKPEDVLLRPGYRMQYMGQLNDLEINSPITGASTVEDWDEAGPRLRRDLCARLCQRGQLARARLRRHRRDHARHRHDAEARTARGTDDGPDASEGGAHRQAPLLSPQEVGARRRLVDGGA